MNIQPRTTSYHANSFETYKQYFETLNKFIKNNWLKIKFNLKLKLVNEKNNHRHKMS